MVQVLSLWFVASRHLLLFLNWFYVLFSCFDFGLPKFCSLLLYNFLYRHSWLVYFRCLVLSSDLFNHGNGKPSTCLWPEKACTWCTWAKVCGCQGGARPSWQIEFWPISAKGPYKPIGPFPTSFFTKRYGTFMEENLK